MDVIRDIRRKEKFQIDDAYLNGYARHCGPMATLVYLSLCRHANSEQQCFPSKKLIGEELNIGERSVYNGLKTLEEWNIIKVEPQERKDDGSYRNNTYTLLDKSVWKPKPQAPGAVSTKLHDPQAPGAGDRGHVVLNKDTHIKETHIKEYAAKAAGVQKPNPLDNPEPCSLPQFVAWCRKSDQRHIRLIGEYADERKIQYTTKGQWASFIRRNLRTARLLAPYTDDQISKAMDELNRAKKDYLRDWTLETLCKFMDKTDK